MSLSLVINHDQKKQSCSFMSGGNFLLPPIRYQLKTNGTTSASSTKKRSRIKVNPPIFRRHLHLTDQQQSSQESVQCKLEKKIHFTFQPKRETRIARCCCGTPVASLRMFVRHGAGCSVFNSLDNTQRSLFIEHVFSLILRGME